MRLVTYWEHGARILVAGAASLALIGVVCGYLGMYRPIVVVPLVAVATAVLWRLWTAGADGPIDATDRGWGFVVGLIGIVVITVLHVRYAGHYVLVPRDPGFYSLMGLELARHGDLAFDGVPEVFRGVSGLRVNTQGYPLAEGGDVLLSQGFHGFSAVLAPGAWLGGPALLLKVPALVGGAALIVFRRLAHRVTASSWVATALTFALGLSLPFGVFTREPYSEALSLLLVLGALLVLVEGEPTWRRYLVAGLIAGAGSAVRIDALQFSTAVLLVMAVGAVAHGRRGRQAVAAGALGLASTSAIGYAVGNAASPVYFSDLRSGVLLQLGLLVVVAALVVGILAAAELVRRGWRPLQLSDGSLRRVADVAAGVVGVAALTWWLAGPLVFTLHGSKDNGLVRHLQEEEGGVVDGTRTYGEMSFDRIAEFYGELAVVLGILGAALAVRAFLRRRDPIAAPLLITGALAAPYLVLPGITPDLPWAMRRYLTVIIPVLLLLAGYGLRRLRGWTRAPRPLQAGLLAFLVAVPAVTFAPVFTVRDRVPALAFVDEVCDALPEDAALIITNGYMGVVGSTTFRSMCDVDVAVSGIRGAGIAAIETASARAAAVGRPLVLMSTRGVEVPAVVRVVERRPVGLDYEYVERTVGRAPTGAERERIDLDLIFVEPQGGSA